MCLKGKTKIKKETHRLLKRNLPVSGSDGFVNTKQKCILKVCKSV